MGWVYGKTVAHMQMQARQIFMKNWVYIKNGKLVILRYMSDCLEMEVLPHIQTCHFSLEREWVFHGRPLLNVDFWLVKPFIFPAGRITSAICPFCLYASIQWLFLEAGEMCRETCYFVTLWPDCFKSVCACCIPVSFLKSWPSFFLAYISAHPKIIRSFWYQK